MTWIHRGLACAVATLASGAFAAAADTLGPVDVTRCGQLVRRGEVGTLRADLHCTAAESSLGLTAEGIFVDFGATLRLGGFTISGDGSGFGVECSSQGAARRGWCVVEGPGEITNFFNGIDGGGGRVRLRNVTVHRNRNGMQYKAPYVIELLDVVMSDNSELGMTSRGGIIRGSDVETSRNGVVGIMGPIARVVRLTAVGNGRLGGAYVQRRGTDRRLGDHRQRWPGSGTRCPLDRTREAPQHDVRTRCAHPRSAWRRRNDDRAREATVRGQLR